MGKHVKIHEIVGVFDRPENLEGAIDGLASSGFDRSEISVLAGEISIRNEFRSYPSVVYMADHPQTPRTFPVMSEEVAIGKGVTAGFCGAMGAAIFITLSYSMSPVGQASPGLAGVCGGVIGILLGVIIAQLIGRHHSARIAEQVKHGGMPLWVRVQTPGKAARARSIMVRNAGHDVHMHEIDIAV